MRYRKRDFVLLSLLTFLLGFACPQGCAVREEEEAEDTPSASPFAGEMDADDVEGRVAAETARLAARERGRDLYRTACATCHGRRGDGLGPSAAALNPRPRDFTPGVYKWRSTESGSLPLDTDIYRTLSRGAAGTMMMGWRKLLSEDERWAVVEYVKSFSSRFEDEGVWEDEIIEVPEPIPATEETIARGEFVYDVNKCWECHGYFGQGDGPSAPTLQDNWGFPNEAFDFTLGLYRGGSSDRDIYRAFFGGLSGSSMPAYMTTIAEEDRWPLVHYVRSLERSPTLLELVLFETP